MVPHSQILDKRENNVTGTNSLAYFARNDGEKKVFFMLTPEASCTLDVCT
jgi:hypothetical protein